VRADEGWTDYYIRPLYPFLQKSPACAAQAEKYVLSDSHYRQLGAQGGRIILENDCLILQIFQMGKAETRKGLLTVAKNL
jgi:hypothetical protein